MIFRDAVAEDLPQIVEMLADDPLGAERESYETPLPESYIEAFRSINMDPNNELVAATNKVGIIGFLQITFIPYLTYQGSWRALIEGVRVKKEFRGQGIGRELFMWAIQRASERHCRLVQLTTDKKRPAAIRFYKSLGFVASHEGMKLHL